MIDAESLSVVSALLDAQAIPSIRTTSSVGVPDTKDFRMLENETPLDAATRLGLDDIVKELGG